MSRIAYVNGRYLPQDSAVVHIEDRGYQFSDGVYEVVPVYRGKLIDEAPHLDRLDYSLGELRIAPPMGRAALKLVLREVLRRNGIERGILYMQVTRGVAPRDHKFPTAAKTALVITAKRLKPPAPGLLANGAAVVTMPDQRWARRDIKSISLLPNILAKQNATEQGGFEAWLVDESGDVTEGSSTNAWIVTREKRVVTRPLGNDILSGITRKRLMELVKGGDFRVEERAFSLAEAHEAAEAFLTSSSGFVLPITRIDGRPVGDGKPGPVAMRLRNLYIDDAEAQSRAGA